MHTVVSHVWHLEWDIRRVLDQVSGYWTGFPVLLLVVDQSRTGSWISLPTRYCKGSSSDRSSQYFGTIEEYQNVCAMILEAVVLSCHF